MIVHNEQEAIEQAIKSGYVPPLLDDDVENGKIIERYDFAQALIDRNFWKALGKAREWRVQDYDDPKSNKFFWYAMGYYETLLSGGDMKAFWESLP